MTLPTAASDAGQAALDALRTSLDGALLVFDFDGTLAPIVPDPDSARAHPEVPGLLASLASGGARIAVLTGRPAALAVRYGSLDAVPGLVVLGHYGAERWQDGAVTAAPVPAGVESVRRQLPDLLAEVGAPEGTYIEDKGRAVAVHTRRSTDPQGGFDLLQPALAELADETGLVLEPGRLVLELRPGGGDKGAALYELVAEVGPRVLLFAGDDLGDLPAFDTVDALRAQGQPALLVCSSSVEVTALAERADVVVDGPGGVVDLLRSLLPDAHGG
jgi:trehalose 6-phosphate phosphatase